MTTLAPTAAPPAPVIGQILVSSWGYEQTNIDFYQVIAVTKASVRIVKLRKTSVPAGTANQVIPVPNSADPADKGVIRRFKSWGKGYSVSISEYASASLWDGEPEYETASGYGH
jgi:hypothetical protein